MSKRSIRWRAGERHKDDFCKDRPIVVSTSTITRDTYAQLVLQVVLLGGQLGGLLLVFLEGTLLTGQRVQESGLLSQQLAVEGLQLLAQLLFLLIGLLSLGGLLF